MTNHTDLIARLRKAKGSEILRSVYLGQINAEISCQQAADALELQQSEITQLELESEGALQIIAAERSEILSLRKQAESLQAEIERLRGRLREIATGKNTQSVVDTARTALQEYDAAPEGE